MRRKNKNSLKRINSRSFLYKLAVTALFKKQASNLAPVCVSRRLLWTGAYRRLALARQGGDPVKAGLTFVAEDEEEEEDEEQDGSKHAMLEAEGRKDGSDNAAGAADADAEGEEILLVLKIDSLVRGDGGLRCSGVLFEVDVFEGWRVKNSSTAFLSEGMVSFTDYVLYVYWDIFHAVFYLIRQAGWGWGCT